MFGTKTIWRINAWTRILNMGISAQIWPATDAEIHAYTRDPGRVAASSNHFSLFSKVPDIANCFAYIHGAREMRPLLDAFASAGLGVHRVVGVADPCYSLTAARVRALHVDQERDPCHRLLASFPTSTAVNRVRIADVVSLAASTDRGLVFYIFEDW